MPVYPGALATQAVPDGTLTALTADGRRPLTALARYKSTGAGDVKQLTDYDPPQFRLRAGDYRVRFQRVGEEVVHVVRVLHRREAYRV